MNNDEEFLVLNEIKKIMEILFPDTFIDEDSIGMHVDCIEQYGEAVDFDQEVRILIYLWDGDIWMESNVNLTAQMPLSHPQALDKNKILNAYMDLKWRSDIRMKKLLGERRCRALGIQT